MAKKRAEKEGEWERLQEERAKLAADIEAKEVCIDCTIQLISKRKRCA